MKSEKLLFQDRSGLISTSPPHRLMSGESDVDKFQRWLQNRLATLEISNDSGDHEHSMIRKQNAIHEVIAFRESIETHSEVEDPFVNRDSPVRVISTEDVEPRNKSDSVCSSCDADMSSDLDFCPLCGEFR